MRRKAGPLATAVVALSAMGVLVLPAPAHAGDTFGLKNCAKYTWTDARGQIQCVIGSWRARARVDCYKVSTGAFTASHFGSYVDVGISSAVCPTGTYAGHLYADYNGGGAVKLG